jgi:hypothetical protein
MAVTGTIAPKYQKRLPSRITWGWLMSIRGPVFPVHLYLDTLEVLLAKVPRSSVIRFPRSKYQTEMKKGKKLALLGWLPKNTN